MHYKITKASDGDVPKPVREELVGLVLQATTNDGNSLAVCVLNGDCIISDVQDLVLRYTAFVEALQEAGKFAAYAFWEAHERAQVLGLVTVPASICALA